MIRVQANDIEPQIVGLMKSYEQLPRHLARKHLRAAMRRVLKPGVAVMRKNTPPVGVKRGRTKKGEKPRSSGALRRAVTTKATAKGSAVFGVLGYKASFESRKAIWLQFGTRSGIAARKMIEKTIAEFGSVGADKLAQEMAVGLEKAAAELASGKNPGRGG